MPADKTWPWEKSKLNVETFNRFERAKYRNGVETGLGVLANGTLQAGAFVVNGYHWVEDSDVVSAFDFSSLLNQPSQETRKLYAQYNYTATDPHANAVYGYATTLPSNAIQLGIITVPASSVSITQGMISTIDASRDLSNRYLSEHAIIDSDTRIPTQDQKNALSGISNPPSSTNRFATEADLPVVSGDNLGNHTALQNLNFNNFKGINCSSPVSSSDIANKQFVLDNVGGQNLASSISQLRKHMMEMQLVVEGITNSPYPDNFGQPFFRTEFEEIGNYVEIDGNQVLQSDHDLTKLSADIITNKRSERGRIDTRLQLPKQYYFGEVVRYAQVPDIANKPHCITYCPDDLKIYMITRGDGVNDTVLHRINLISLQVEASWFFDETTFSRWNGIASGITYGNGRLYIMEYDAVNKDAVCIRFKVDALPPQGTRITKSNVGAVESAGCLEGSNGDIFTDIAYDSVNNLIWAMRKTGASSHRLVRVKVDFTENGAMAYDANSYNTSSVDTSINGIDLDPQTGLLWCVGDSWIARIHPITTAITTKFKSYGKTGVCYVSDNNLPSVKGQLFNTDKTDVKMWVVALRNTLSLPASANYKPIHATAIIQGVDNTTKVVTLTKLDGGSSSFVPNEFKDMHMRVGNVYWNIASNAANTVTLDTQLDISSLSGKVELGTVQKNFATTLTTKGMKVWGYEGGVDNTTATSAGFMLTRNTEIGGVGIELGTVTTQGNIEMRIETDTNGAPSGTLAHANATTTISSGSLVASSWNTKSFANAFTLNKDTIYHFKIVNGATCQIKGHNNGFNDFQVGANTINVRIYNNARLEIDVVSDVAVHNNRLYTAYKQAAGSTEYKPDGAAGIDSYIDEGNPTLGYGNDALMRIACNQGTGNADVWAQMNAVISARKEHSAVLYNNKMYVFGGHDGTNYLNDLWECDLTTFVWVQRKSGASIRSNHKTVVYNGKMYMFGGRESGPYLNDLWECDLTTFTWTQKTSGATGRSLITAIVDAGKIYVFGGWDGTSYLNDLWECNLSTFTWTQKTSGASVRRGHTAVVYNGKMYVFGGTNGTGSYLNDLWECDLTSFTWAQKTSGATARWGSASVLNGTKIYIFGGCTSTSNNFNDLWECDLSTFTWTQKTSGATNRYSVTSVINAGKMYIFGGWGTVHLADVWECDLTSFAWVKKFGMDGPTGRRAASTVEYNGKMYVFGGYNGAYLNELWEYDLANFTWIQRTSGATARSSHAAVVNAGKMYIFGGGSTSPTHVNDLWECDLTTFTWTQKTSGATVRASITAVVNAGKMYVFGGHNGSTYLSDFWECDLTTFTWTSKTSGASARHGYTAVAYSGKMYLFGGWNGTTRFNDLWECNLTTFTWTQKASGATTRMYPVSAVNGSKMYIYGGQTPTPLNDLWECDLTTFTWTQKASGATSRESHQAIGYSGKMYIFGGTSDGGTTNLNDVWEVNLTSFAWLNKGNVPPSGRWGHSTVVNGTKMYVFGGWSGSVALSDFWEFDLTTFAWAQKTSGPSARSGQSAVVYNGKMYVFGGWTGSTRLNDLWECDLTSFVWTQKTSGSSTRDAHSAVIYGGRMYVFGGYSGSTRLNDLWECDLSTFTWTSKTGGATGRSGHSAVLYGTKMYVFGGYSGTSLNDLWECDLATFTWTQKTSGSSVRYTHAAVVNSGKMYIFAGANNTVALSDLWQCDLTSFTWTQKTGVSNLRSDQSAILYSNKMYIFGGKIAGAASTNLWEYTIAGVGVSVSKQRGIFKFDLAGLPTTAVTATLSLYLDSANAASKTVNLHRLTSVFTEGDVSWDNRIAATAWGTAGGDYSGTVEANASVTNTPGYVTFNITSLYNAWKAGIYDNNGVVVKLSDEVTADNYVYWASSDNGDANKRPKLTISANPTSYNVGILTRDRLVSSGYGGSVTQAMRISDSKMYLALSNEVRVVDLSDNSVLQVINNTSYPGITSTVIKDIAAKKLIEDDFTQRIHQYLVVCCNNGVSIINMTTGTSFPIYNYEIASGGATCKKVNITDDGKLVIVTETSSGVNQIDIFGDITKIYTSNTNKTWEQQTGLRKTIDGPSGSGILPSDLIMAVDTVGKLDSLKGYDSNLILIANGPSLIEYDLKTEKVRTIDTVTNYTCYDATYFGDTINAIYSDGVSDGIYKQYDTYLKRLNYSIGKSSSTYSRLQFENWDLQALKILENKLVVITTAAGVELVDLTYRDTNAFGSAEWYSNKLHDANGIARATVMMKDFRMPREVVKLSSTAAKGAVSVTLDFGNLGAIVSAGDVLYLYSTSMTSSGNGEAILVDSSYNEASNTIPLATTTLAENIDESSTVIELSSQSVVDGLPVQGVIKIGSEQILYNGKAGANVLVVSRGVNGTTAASHLLGNTVNTVLRFDYQIGDEVVFLVDKKRINNLLDVRVMESNDGITWTEGSQVLVSDVNTGYCVEAVRSDLPYGQLKISLKRTDYHGDTVAISSASMYWENY